MSDSEKDLENIPEGSRENTDEGRNDIREETSSPDVSAEIVPDGDGDTPDDTLEEKDGVKYETNDNWEFDASAPSLDDNIVLGNDDYEISISSKPAKKSDVKTAPEPAPVDTSNQIVINKEPLKFIPLAIFIAAVIAVLAVLGVRYYTVPNGREGDMMNPGSVVAQIDGVKVSTGMYNYYYSSIVSYYEQYASYGYIELDTTESYEEQYTTDDEGNAVSWAEFFEQEALEELKATTAYYVAGLEAGVTLTDTQQETIDSQIESLKTSASESEMSLEQYISSSFGEYCTEDTLRLMLEQYYITANYKGMIGAETQFTDDEIDKYFTENEDNFKNITFSYLAFEYDTTDEDTMQESLDNAISYMSKMTDEDAVKALVPEVYADYIESDAQSAMESDNTVSEEDARADAVEMYEENTVAEITASETPFDDEVTQWLFSDSTATGSTNYYADESAGYIYVLLKTQRATLNDDNTYSVRHILICPESDESEEESETVTYTDEQWAQAEKKANDVLDEFKSGDADEYSFALLAEQYSEDTASTSAGSDDCFGGLYEGVTEGEMVPEYEEWSLDSSRKYGDTGIVKSDYGYHIMFFVSSGPQYKADIITELRNQKLTEITENSDVKLHESVIDRAVESHNSSSSDASAE